MYVKVVAWNMEHFYSNSQMARFFWLNCGLSCVSLTEAVKHNKKPHHLFSDTVTMIIKSHRFLG